MKWNENKKTFCECGLFPFAVFLLWPEAAKWLEAFTSEKIEAVEMMRNLFKILFNVVFIWVFLTVLIFCSNLWFREVRKYSLIEYNFIYCVRFNTCVWWMVLNWSAMAAREKDLNNNHIHNIFRLTLFSASVLDSSLVNGSGFELLLRHSFEYELFKFGKKSYQ